MFTIIITILIFPTLFSIKAKLGLKQFSYNEENSLKTAADFVLSGTEEYHLSSLMLITGDVIIEDQAKLYIHNGGKIVISSSSDFTYNFIVNNSAQLILQNGHLERDNAKVAFYMLNSSILSADQRSTIILDFISINAYSISLIDSIIKVECIGGEGGNDHESWDTYGEQGYDAIINIKSTIFSCEGSTIYISGGGGGGAGSDTYNNALDRSSNGGRGGTAVYTLNAVNLSLLDTEFYLSGGGGGAAGRIFYYESGDTVGEGGDGGDTNLTIAANDVTIVDSDFFLSGGGGGSSAPYGSAGKAGDILISMILDHTENLSNCKVLLNKESYGGNGGDNSRGGLYTSPKSGTAGGTGIGHGGANGPSGDFTGYEMGHGVPNSGINLFCLINNSTDPDEDKLSNYDELVSYFTNPINNDTDNDGLSDFEEVITYNCDPNLNDTDSDGLTDYEEIITYNTNPNSKDTDGDGLTDGNELSVYFTDPNDQDTDDDGYSDGMEIFWKTDPNNFNDTPLEKISLAIIIPIIIFTLVFTSIKIAKKIRKRKYSRYFPSLDIPLKPVKEKETLRLEVRDLSNEAELEFKQGFKRFEELLRISKALMKKGNQNYSEKLFTQAINAWEKAIENYESALKIIKTKKSSKKIKRNILNLRENICYTYFEKGKSHESKANIAYKKKDLFKTNKEWNKALINYERTNLMITSNKSPDFKSKIKELNKNIKLKMEEIRLKLNIIKIEEKILKIDESINKTKSIQDIDLVKSISITTDSILQYSDMLKKAEMLPNSENLLLSIQKKLHVARNYHIVLQNKIEALIPSVSSIPIPTVHLERKEEVDFKKHTHTIIIKSPINQIRISKGGDWKVEGDQSVFYYKVKIENKTQFILTNIQILLTSIPPSLQCHKDRYIINYLKPNSYESPTFKLKAQQSCVGDSIEGIVTYLDPNGHQQNITIEPHIIKYVCNLLVPKKVSSKEFKEKLKYMEKKELILECDASMAELEEIIDPLLLKNNFHVIEPLKSQKGKEIKIAKGYAQGKYDQKDVAILLMTQTLQNSTRLIIQAMSDDKAKLMDILRDISYQCDDIKSDTELLKEYSSQLEEIFTNRIDEVEIYLKEHLAADWEKFRNIWQDYKSGNITWRNLVWKGLKIYGKKFIKIIIREIPK